MSIMSYAEKEQVFRSLQWEDLRQLWAGVDVPGTVGWPKGTVFEYCVVRAFELAGARVRYPFDVETRTGIKEQIDGAVYAQGLYCLVECKDLAKPMNFEPIAKLGSQLMRRPSGVVGLVFSRKGFTGPAISLTYQVGPNSIILWNGSEFGRCLDNGGIIATLMLKYERLVESGMPDYDPRAGIST